MKYDIDTYQQTHRLLVCAGKVYTYLCKNEVHIKRSVKRLPIIIRTESGFQVM